MKALSTLSQLTMRRIYWRKSRVTILLRLPAYRWCSMLFLHCWICAAGDFTPEMVVRKTSHAVAERFQLKDRGYIREGYWADLVVIDPFSHQQIIREDVAYKCGWSPFEGRILSGGAVDMTLVNGHVIWNGHSIQQKYGLPLEFCR